MPRPKQTEKISETFTSNSDTKAKQFGHCFMLFPKTSSSSCLPVDYFNGDLRELLKGKVFATEEEAQSALYEEAICSPVIAELAMTTEEAMAAQKQKDELALAEKVETMNDCPVHLSNRKFFY